MDYILTIDQGTTSSRALTYDMRGNIISIAQKEITQYYPKPGWVEHDPIEILSTQIDVAKQAIEQSGGVNGLLSVAITNQRETTIIWDRKSGKPKYKAIVWQCRRSSEISEKLKSDYYELIKNKTGLVVDAYFSATKLMWLFEHIPGIQNLAKKGKLSFGTVDSWLIYNLTGEHLTDYSNASRTMLFNINKLSWDQELLNLMGIPESLLPEARPSFSNFGNVKKEIFGKEVPIYGVIGDQQSSLLGQGCINKGMVKNTYGTGCFLVLNTGKKIINSSRGLLTSLFCSPEGDPLYVLEGSVFIAGAAIQWLRDGLGLIKKAAETELIARNLSSTNGVYVVPAFTGLGAPYWDSSARGGILGITRGTKREHVIRATLESIAYQTRDVIDVMSREAGISLSKLKVDGGVSQNNWLMQFQADILNIPVERPYYMETTSTGAGYIAGVSVGYWKKEEISHLWKKDRIFVPRMQEKTREKLYEGWKEAVKRILTY